MTDLDLEQKIMGAMFGCAIGDALGVGAEFMSKGEVAVRYPNGIHDYSEIYQDAHRSQWEPGEWTNDTEINIRMMQTIVRTGGYDVCDIGRAFKEWYMEGHTDMVSSYRFIFNDPRYDDNPELVSQEVWEQMGAEEASNEANVRAPFIGLSADDHLQRGAQICRITHADPRCIGANMALAHMAHKLMWHDRAATVDEIVDIVRPVDDRIVPYVRWATEDTLDALDLDEDESFWYTRKAMAAGLWAVWHDLTPMEAFDCIFTEGGDVDTNCAVALTLLGIRHGEKAFPKHLKEGLKDHDRLVNVAKDMVQHFKTRQLSHAGKHCG